jgi:hypothetical protein
MTKPELLRALQTEIHRHTFDTFVENPPSMAEGGKGVVVPGCPACRKRINLKGDALHSLPFLLDQNKNAVLCVLLERSSRATLRVAPSKSFPTCKPWTSQIGSKFAGEGQAHTRFGPVIRNFQRQLSRRARTSKLNRLEDEL